MGGMVGRMSFRIYLTYASISKLTMDLDLRLDSHYWKGRYQCTSGPSRIWCYWSLGVSRVDLKHTQNVKHSIEHLTIVSVCLL
jgi:hypothetical protein